MQDSVFRQARWPRVTGRGRREGGNKAQGDDPPTGLTSRPRRPPADFIITDMSHCSITCLWSTLASHGCPVGASEKCIAHVRNTTLTYFLLYKGEVCFCIVKTYAIKIQPLTPRIMRILKRLTFIILRKIIEGRR